MHISMQNFILVIDHVINYAIKSEVWALRIVEMLRIVPTIG
jgi:hypothetical protein